MARITNITPANFLGAILASPRVLGSKVSEIITAVTEKGTVTQNTAITTAVTLNKQSGVITTVSSTLAAGSNASFTVNNNKCYSDSVVMLTVDDSASAGLAKLNVQSVANGSFVVNITNIHGANASNNVIKIHFTII